jgi:hypothetical protein
MDKKKRNSRSYKCTDAIYKASMKRAKKDKLPLSKTVEIIVTAYADGMKICAIPFPTVKPIE